MILSLVYKQQI